MAAQLRGALLLSLLVTACRSNAGGGDPIAGDEDTGPPVWRIGRVTHGLGDRVLHDLWIDGGGNVHVVGQFGFMMTNRGPQGTPVSTWRQLPTPTQSHLTAIAGVNNGGLFGLAGHIGEMIAVGWHGTVLHYHPNPDGEATTDDGAWSLVAGPEGESMASVVRIDPACPDWDGDGFADDGDGSGYSGDALCFAGARLDCDDNCRKTANGNMRPVVDGNVNGCVDPADTPDPDPAKQQRDADGDGRGEVCDPDDQVAEPIHGFDTALFDVVVESQDLSGTAGLRVVAVGGDGALVTFDGPSVAATASPLPPITAASAWVAQSSVTYRYDDDCDASTPPGTDCGAADHIPPSCPAQCHPRRVGPDLTAPCVCPPNSQCCDPTASTGVGCSDTSCPPAPNACVGGNCSTLCPACLRRQQGTLRGVARGANHWLAVGADGRFLVRDDPTDPSGLWQALVCNTLPEPLDEDPLLVSVAASGGGFAMVGAAGSMFLVDPTADRFSCQAPPESSPLSGGRRVQSRLGLPSAFLHDVHLTGATRGFVVGDRGLLLEFGGERLVTEMTTGVEENLHAVAYGTDPVSENPLLWVAGAAGVLLRGEYY